MTKRIVALLLSVMMLVTLLPAGIFASDNANAIPNLEEPALGDYYFDLKATPVRIPKVSEGLESQGGVTLWEGSKVNFGAEGASVVTFVIKATGIDTPVSLTRFLPVNYTMTGSINYWAVNNTWGDGNTGLDGVGTEHPFALNIPKDGTYVISLGRKVFGMDAGGKVLTIPKIKVADINSNYKAKYPLVNDNENAQLSLLSVSAGNPTVTAYFYNEDGTSIGTATYEYPKASEASDSTTAKKTTCKTVDDMFALTGAVLPTKVDPNGEYTYVLQWVDGNGDPVDAIYKNMNVFANFIPVATDQSVVKFLDANGTQIQSSLVSKGTTPPVCAAPSKGATEDLAYTFAGWSIDGENVVDMTTYVVEEDVTFMPVFVQDQILKAEVVLPVEGVKMGETAVATVKLNRSDLTTGVALSNGTSGVASNVTEPIVSGEVVLSYNTSLLSAEGGNGTVTVAFTEVDTDGTTNATVTFTAAADAAGQTTVAVQSGKVSTASVTDHTVIGLSTNVAVTGQQTGAYFNGEPVAINKNKDDGSKPDRQVLWKGNVTTGGSDGITFVYKLEGVESPINASNNNIVFNGDTHAWNSWNWQNGGNNGGMVSAKQIFESDGYYFMYVNKVPNGGTAYKTVNEFIVFQNPNDKEGPNRDNPNANATFQMLAVVADNLTPTLNFYNEDGSKLITTYTHEYTNYSDYMWNSKAKTIGNLITVGKAIETVAVPTPVKESDDINTYTFDGWVDAEGNAIDTSAAFYMSTDVYAHFKATPKTTSYTVKFMNGEEEFDSQSVWENGYAAVPERTPVKADDATGTFTFAGWSLDGTNVIAPESVVITENTTFVAVYNHQNVEFTVTYMHGDKVFYTETVVRSLDAAYEGVPTIDTDAYVDEETTVYYHKFEKWVDAEGADAVLTNVQDNVTVYAQFVDLPVETWYTVNWLDKDGTVLSSKKVAAGDGTATSVTGAFNGKGDENYWYSFNGWDKETTAINADTDVNIVYNTTDVNTSSILTSHTVTGKVVDKTMLFSSEVGTYKWAESGIHDFSLLVKIEGASEENPVTLGGMRTNIGGIDSNNSGNYGTSSVLFNAVTEDGYYYANIGGYVLTWVSSDVMNSLAFSDPDSTRGGVSADASGAATFTATFVPQFFTPEVRFYGKDGQWLATNRITTGAGHWSYDRVKAPTLASLYNGADLGEGFLYWADAEGNQVTQLYDSMDVYAVYECTHEECTIIGAGIVQCDRCGEIIEGAPTVVSGSAELSAMQTGDTFTVPVTITNNPGLVGITLSVETSENVELTSASVDGTLFDGAMVSYSKKVMINKGLEAENITADGTIVNLTFTALSDILSEDTVSIKVTMTDGSTTDLTIPKIYSGLTVNYRNSNDVAIVNYDSLGFTVGNTLALNIRMSCNQYEDTYTMCDSWTMYLDSETEPGVWTEVSSQTLEKSENVTFTLSGIPAVYLVNNLKVRFVGNGKYGVDYLSEKENMTVNGEELALSFVNYSLKVKETYKDENLENLLNSMLNYSAQVQIYKGYKVDSLANAGLSEAEKTFMSIEDPNYDWSAYSSQKRGVTASANKDVKITHSQILLGTEKIGFRFYFKLAEGADIDVSTLTAKVKYTDALGAEVIKEISEFTLSSYYGEYYAVFDGFDPTSFDTQMVVAIYQNGTKVSNTAYDSIPTMAMQVAQDVSYAAMRPVLSSILAYNRDANTYFENK